MIAEGLPILNLTRPPAHLHRLFQRYFNNLRRAVRQPSAFIRLVVDFGIWPLTDIDIINLVQAYRRKASEQQAADQKG